MRDLPDSFRHIVEQFVAFATPRRDIRAAQIVGSWARGDGDPQWSDLDIEFYTTRPLSYRQDTAWITHIAPLWMAGPDDDGRAHRRWDARWRGWTWFTTLESGIAVDFMIVPYFELVWGALTARFRPRTEPHPDAILIDKDGRLQRSGYVAFAPQLKPPARPGAEAFAHVLHECWGTIDRSVRKLGRGDLYEAHRMIHGGFKQHLLRLLVWHACACKSYTGPEPYRHCTLSEWADPRAVAVFPELFACYDAADIGRALSATLDVLRWAGRETAEALGYTYPAEQIVHLDEWIMKALKQVCQQ